jgi:hypothetical protein
LCSWGAGEQQWERAAVIGAAAASCQHHYADSSSNVKLRASQGCLWGEEVHVSIPLSVFSLRTATRWRDAREILKGEPLTNCSKTDIPATDF